MKRWWADPTSSEEILKSIDDTDVLQGVGSAFLGYHGLAMGVLKPLISETLVDVLTVRNALNTVDLEPLAVALSKATRPVMGDASDNYGQMLANDFHERATDATHRLLMTWTNTGMAWPTAIERASEVHGVPIERLGRYASVMKSAGINPHVRADYADRALMEYASEVGQRESANSSEVISKNSKSNAFEEAEHPRGLDGKFTNKKVSDEQKIKSIKDLKARRKGVINRTAPKATESVQESRKFVFKPVSEKAVTPLENRSTSNRVLAANRVNAVSRKAFTGNLERRFNGNRVDDSAGQGTIWDNTVYVPISYDLYKTILNQKAFAMEQVGQLAGFRKDQLIDNLAGYNLQDIVILRIVGAAVQTETMQSMTDATGFGNPRLDVYEAKMHPKSTYSFEGTPFEEGIPLDDDSGFSDIPVKVHEVMLLNYDDFLSDGKYGRVAFGKASAFEESEHPRAINGRFTDKNVTDIKRAEEIKRIREIKELRKKRAGVVNRNQKLSSINATSTTDKKSFSFAPVKIAEQTATNRVNAQNRVKGQNRVLANKRLKRAMPNPDAKLSPGNSYILATWHDVKDPNKPFSAIANNERVRSAINVNALVGKNADPTFKNVIQEIKYKADNWRTEDETAQWDVPEETATGVSEAENRYFGELGRAAYHEEYDADKVYAGLQDYVDNTESEIQDHGWAVGLMSKYNIGPKDQHGEVNYDVDAGELAYQAEAVFDSANQVWRSKIVGYDFSERFYILTGNADDLEQWKRDPNGFTTVKDDEFEYLHDMLSLVNDNMENITYDPTDFGGQELSTKFTDPPVEVYRLEKVDNI